MRIVRGALATLILAVVACGGADTVTSTATGGGGGGGGGGGDTCPSTSTSVTVSDNLFTPPCTKVPVGSTVTWTWSGANPHNVTFANSALGASQTQTAGTYQKTFANAGTFNYDCTVHPGMSGSVQVQ